MTQFSHREFRSSIPDHTVLESRPPVVFTSRLALREGNSKKPIYQIHKWWVRRLGSVFRTILLSATRSSRIPGDSEELFYQKNSLRSLVVLDPFVGGGTSLVEAAKCGANVIGVDIDPVACFITAKELAPFDEAALTVLNAANFSVPGSGKTQSALAVYHTLRSQGLVDRLLVVGPASCFAPWEDEFDAVFGRPINSLRVIGKRSERAALLKEIADVDIILCTYQMASRERDSLAKVLTSGRYLFVLDESHHVKNIALGPWAKTAVELAPLAERRMILTGTPAPHSLYDLWSQFTFLWPSQAVMRTRSQFEQRIDGKRDPVRIIKREIDPFFIRTKKSDPDLPEPIPDVQKIAYHDIPERQRLIIRLLELRTLQEAKKLLDRTDVAILRHWRRARTLRFLQAASNPALLTTSLQNVGDYGAPLDDDAALAVLLRDYLKHEMPAKIGYDIISVEPDETPRFIEVKSSTGQRLRFEWSAGERRFAKEYGDRYWIYFVPLADILEGRDLPIFMIQNPIKWIGRGLLTEEATSWRVTDPFSSRPTVDPQSAETPLVHLTFRNRTRK